MKTDRKWFCLGLGALLLAVLLLPCCLSAQAEDGAEQPDMMLILAQSAARNYGLTDAQGQELVPRSAPEMNGRGVPEQKGVEPDYRGVVGYVVLQSDWEVSRFSSFARTPWYLPVYEPDGEDWKVAGEIQHKTPVLVSGQQIREGKGYKYAGYLHVVRLDTMEETWIDVTQFVTVPYWTLELKEAAKYGFCVAVYRSRSRFEPMDRKKHRGPLPEATRVLVCDKTKFPRYNSPDKENHPLLGIVFRSQKESESYFRVFLFFNTEDLTLVY